MMDQIASVDAVLSYFGATLFVFGLLSCLWRRTFKFGVVTLLLANVPLAAAIAFPKKVLELLHACGFDLSLLPEVNLGNLLGMGSAIILFLFCFILFLLFTKPKKQSNYTAKGYSVEGEEGEDFTYEQKLVNDYEKAKRKERKARNKNKRRLNKHQEPQLGSEESFAHIDFNDDNDPALSAADAQRAAKVARDNATALADNEPIFPLGDEDGAQGGYERAKGKNKKGANRNRSLHLNSYDNPLNLRAARRHAQRQSLADSLGEPTLSSDLFQQYPDSDGEPPLDFGMELNQARARTAAAQPERPSANSSPLYDLAAEGEPDLEELQLAGSKVSDLLEVLEHSSLKDADKSESSQAATSQSAMGYAPEGYAEADADAAYAAAAQGVSQELALNPEAQGPQGVAAQGNPSGFASFLNDAQEPVYPETKGTTDSLITPDDFAAQAAQAAVTSADGLAQESALAAGYGAANEDALEAMQGGTDLTSAYAAAANLDSSYNSSQLKAHPEDESLKADESYSVSAQVKAAQYDEAGDFTQNPDAQAAVAGSAGDESATPALAPSANGASNQGDDATAGDTNGSWRDNLDLLHVWAKFPSKVKELFAHPENTNGYGRDLISYSFMLETEPPMQSRPLFSVEGFMDNSSYVDKSRFTATFHEGNLRSLLGERVPPKNRALSAEPQTKEIKPASAQAAAVAAQSAQAQQQSAATAQTASAPAPQAPAPQTATAQGQGTRAASQTAPQGPASVAQAAANTNSARTPAQAVAPAAPTTSAPAPLIETSAAPVHAPEALSQRAAAIAQGQQTKVEAQGVVAAAASQSAQPRAQSQGTVGAVGGSAAAAAVAAGAAQAGAVEQAAAAVELPESDSNVLSDSVIPNVQSLDKLGQNDFIGAGLTVAEALAQLGSEVITTASAIEARNKQRAAQSAGGAHFAHNMEPMSDKAAYSASAPASDNAFHDSQAASLASVVGMQRAAQIPQGKAPAPALAGAPQRAASAATPAAQSSQLAQNAQGASATQSAPNSQATQGLTTPPQAIGRVAGATGAPAGAGAAGSQSQGSAAAAQSAGKDPKSKMEKSPLSMVQGTGAHAMFRTGFEAGGAHTLASSSDSDYVLLATLQTTAQDNAQAREESYLYQSAPLNINIPVAELNSSANNILGGGLVLTPAAPHNLSSGSSMGLTISNAATGATSELGSGAAPAATSKQVPAATQQSPAPIQQQSSAQAPQSPVASGPATTTAKPVTTAPAQKAPAAPASQESLQTTPAAAARVAPAAAPAGQIQLSGRSALAINSGTMTKAMPKSDGLQLFSVATGEAVSAQGTQPQATAAQPQATASATATTTTTPATSSTTASKAPAAPLSAGGRGVLEVVKPESSALVVQSVAGGETHLAAVNGPRSSVPVQPAEPDANTKILTRPRSNAALPETSAPVSAQVPLSALAVTQSPRTRAATPATSGSSAATTGANAANNAAQNGTKDPKAKASAQGRAHRAAPVLTPVRPNTVVTPVDPLDNKAKILSTLKQRRRLQEQQAAAEAKARAEAEAKARAEAEAKARAEAEAKARAEAEAKARAEAEAKARAEAEAKARAEAEAKARAEAEARAKAEAEAKARAEAEAKARAEAEAKARAEEEAKARAEAEAAAAAAATEASAARTRKKLRLTAAERRARIERDQKEQAEALRRSKEAQAQAHAKDLAEAQAKTQAVMDKMEQLAAARAAAAAEHEVQAAAASTTTTTTSSSSSEAESATGEHQLKHSLKLNVRSRLKAAAEAEAAAAAVPTSEAGVGAEVPSSEEHNPSLLGRRVPQSIKKRLHGRASRNS